VNTAFIRDKFGNLWPADYELCPECRQPDNCGDCNHQPLSREHVRDLGGQPCRVEAGAS
jgi:hypothetical protein